MLQLGYKDVTFTLAVDALTAVRGVRKDKRWTVIDRRKRAGSHPQAGAVRVGSDHGEAVSWQVASAHGEGDEAGEVPGHKVLKRAADRNEKLWITQQKL